MPILPYISDDDFISEVKKVLLVAEAANAMPVETIYSNVVDPFSAIFDTYRQRLTLTEWLKKERDRQIQKTIQNALGTFHQGILGSMAGWTDLGTGAVVDLVNDDAKIIAEVKNKYNTTKGNHKKEIYDDIKSVLGSTYSGYTGYYVEVIPARKEPYKKPFTPSDNITHINRTSREDILVIDGKSFYALASGYPNAIDMLYSGLPVALGKILGSDPSLARHDQAFEELFYRAYLQ